MKRIRLPSGENVPALGMGTWMIGENPSRRDEEIATIQRGIDLGMTLIDTAEMYGDGSSEKLVGAAIKGQREKVFLVSKVYPHNASRKAMPTACERSLKRLGVDCIDLYLLHWRGTIPLQESVEAFETLKTQGKIRHWGVSNLDQADMRELGELPNGTNVALNQVLYNLSRRGIEWDLLPWCKERGIPLMAYSPVEQGRLLRHAGLCELARRYGMTPAQLSIAWLLRNNQLIAIPKVSNRAHLEDNFRALQYPIEIPLLDALDRLFPPPHRAMPLEML